MQTEPEQWAVELMEAALAVFCENTTEDGALVIQRAFEERERKLREEAKRETELLNLAVRAQEALQASAYRAGMKFGWNCCDAGASEKYAQAMEGTEHIAELKRIRQARQALKETPDAG